GWLTSLGWSNHDRFCSGRFYHHLCIGLWGAQPVATPGTVDVGFVPSRPSYFGGGLRSGGGAILFAVHHRIEVWAVQNLPYWLQDLSVRF
ncbi:MAG: hypothetical protein ABNH01_04820, partial [Planktomarina sp.]